MYKLFNKNLCLPPGGINKLLLAMKITVILLIATIMQVSAVSFAQKITLNKRNVTLTQVFDEVRKQTGYDVLYGSAKLKGSTRINAKFNNSPLEEVMDQVVKGTGLAYTIEDKVVVIKEKDKGFFANLIARFQAIDVSGRVVDEKGEPLSGVTIKVKDGSHITTTEKDGLFLLKNIDEKAVLVISFIGYLTKEVNAKADLGTIALEISTSKLDEIQVIAYGTTTKRFSTGNISSVKADMIATQPVTNPLLALSGRVPGLFIRQPSGVPGDAVEVNIQGKNSIMNGNDPFYVIDGVPFPSKMLAGINSTTSNSEGSALSFINPSDIESIEILKDADATAIYGSRAANGAILITTKKGKEGDTKVNVNSQTGWGQITRKLNLLNGAEYVALRKEALANSGRAIGAEDYDINGVWDINKNTDWQKELVGGTAKYTNLQITLSAGSENTQFLVGGGYNRQTTVYPTDRGDDKGNIHFNINHSSNNEKLKFNLSGSYQEDVNKLGGIDFMQLAIVTAPNAPNLRNADGTLNWGPIPSQPGAYSFDNPLKYLEISNTSKTNNLVGSSLISYEIVSGLQWRFQRYCSVLFRPKCPHQLCHTAAIVFGTATILI